MTHIILCKRQSGFEIHFIPNGLEKYMSLLWERHLIFINKMQVTISSLDILVKNIWKVFISQIFWRKVRISQKKMFLCIQIHRKFLKVWRRVDKFIDNFERYAY